MTDTRKPPSPAPPMESMINLTVRVRPSTRAELEVAAAAAGEEPMRHARRMIELGLQVSRMGLKITDSGHAAPARIGGAHGVRRRA